MEIAAGQANAGAAGSILGRAKSNVEILSGRSQSADSSGNVEILSSGGLRFASGRSDMKSGSLSVVTGDGDGMSGSLRIDGRLVN